MNIARNTSLVLTALLLAACASAPQRNEELDQARSAVQALAADPLASQTASGELASARRELAAAESALQKHKGPETVTHLAYLATRNAQIGQARLSERRKI